MRTGSGESSRGDTARGTWRSQATDTANKGRTVPAPGMGAQQPYTVYRVYPADNSDTYKFGITSNFNDGGEDGWVANRPTVALSKCVAYYSALGNDAGCVWSVMPPAPDPDYFTARTHEYTLIRNYQILNNGYCPPGQASSCK